MGTSILMGLLPFFFKYFSLKIRRLERSKESGSMKISDQCSVEFGGSDQDHVSSLLGLPQKIMRHHELPGIAQLVLHEFGHGHLFQLKKAIYLADNPDFNHLVGVAGFSEDECHLHDEDVWGNPSKAIEVLDSSSYNKEVKNFLKNSLKARGIDFHDKAEIEKFGHDLGMQQPQFLAWDMKHGNHGLLVFEYQTPSTIDVIKHKLLTHAVSLLGFCPIF